MPKPLYDSRVMGRFNRKLQRNPNARGFAYSSDALAQAERNLTPAELDHEASMFCHGVPNRITNDQFMRARIFLGQVRLGIHDGYAKRHGLTRRELEIAFAHRMGFDDELREILADGAATALGAEYATNIINERRSKQEERPLSKYDIDNFKDRKSASLDQVSRKAMIRKLVDGSPIEGTQRPLYDPAQHERPGHEGRRADIALAMAQEKFKADYGVPMESGLVPSEIGDAAIEQTGSEMADDAAWGNDSGGQ
jgi:hypothetical protein